jgi:hypothetical protein
LVATVLAGSAGAGRASATADPLDQPPAGLVPSTARLSDILAAHERVVGSRSAGAQDTVIEHWTFVDSGMAGTEDLERSASDYRSRIASGPFVDEYGQRGESRWHEDANGFLTSTTEDDWQSFYSTRVLEDAADPKNDASVIGEAAAAQPAYVVKVKRPGDKYAEYFFYDKTSAQIVRVERIAHKRRIVQTYSDFRVDGGISRPWHVSRYGRSSRARRRLDAPIASGRRDQSRSDLCNSAESAGHLAGNQRDAAPRESDVDRPRLFSHVGRLRRATRRRRPWT